MNETRLREMIEEFHDLRGRWTNKGDSPEVGALAIALGISEWAMAQDDPNGTVDLLFQLIQISINEEVFDNITRPRTTKT